VEDGAWGKTPFLIHRQDRAPLRWRVMERWHGEDGARIESCTILVTDANALVRTIHDRMPVILAREDYGAWLDPGNQDADGSWRCSSPPSGALGAASGLAAGEHPRNDGPELLDAVASES